MESEHDTTVLYPISYRCPGGLKLTYNTTIPAYLPRLRHTIIGGVALWRMWMREVLHMLMIGKFPSPSIVTQNISGDISQVFQRLKLESAVVYAKPPKATTEAPDTVKIVRRRLADGRTIADIDVHRLVVEIDRLRLVIRTVREDLGANDVAGAEAVLKNSGVEP